MIAKTEKELTLLREGGKILASILRETIKFAKTKNRVTAKKIDEYAERLILKSGSSPSFKGYKDSDSKKIFPSAACISVNDEIVHGIPLNRELKNGDLVGIDIGIKHKGLYLDMAETIAIGKVSEVSEKLLYIGKESLARGISVAKEGGFIGDISYAIQSFVESAGFQVVRELVGHGVGAAVHEDPEVPNWGKRGAGVKLKKGMVLALEPMVVEGDFDIILDKNGWTYKTKDGKCAVHFEHTILITEKKAEILTIS